MRGACTSSASSQKERKWLGLAMEMPKHLHIFAEGYTLDKEERVGH